MIFFLDGLPGAGKTTLLELLHKTASVVPEILDQDKLATNHNKPDQKFFLDNDERKVQLALSLSQPVFIERSPLSTFFFNEAKVELNRDHDFVTIENWYQQTFAKLFTPENNFRFIILDIPPSTSLARKERETNEQDPWANPSSLAKIRESFLEFSRDNKAISTVIDATHPPQDTLNQIKLYNG